MSSQILDISKNGALYEQRVPVFDHHKIFSKVQMELLVFVFVFVVCAHYH